MNRRKRTTLVALTTLALSGCRGESERDTVTPDVMGSGAARNADQSNRPDTAPLDPIYTVADYDPSRDPVADLKETVARATSERKRIILEIGGQW